MNIPDRNRCYQIISEKTIPEHIIDHCRMVSKVASFLSCSLTPMFPNINIRLATASALLHDITKYESFSTGQLHSESGRKFIEEKGYPEVADIIRQHVILDTYTAKGPVTEAEIVNYSDKRTLHDHIVSLDERLEYIRHRYGSDKKLANKIDIMWKNTKDLENKIFELLAFPPEDLKKKVGNHPELYAVPPQNS